MYHYRNRFGGASCDVQAIVTARFVEVVSVSARCSHFFDIWSSSQSNKSLFCARLAQQMRDVFLGNTNALTDYKNETVLAAFDDWRWDICRLRDTQPSVVITSLARALDTCMSVDFRPIGRTLAGLAADRGSSTIAHDVLSSLQDRREDGQRLVLAERQFQQAVRRALAA